MRGSATNFLGALGGVLLIALVTCAVAMGDETIFACSTNNLSRGVMEPYAPSMWSSTFALFLSCAGYSTYGYCPASASTGSNLAGNGVTLTVRESPGWGPTFTSTSGLWNTSGWVRGIWSLGFTSSALPGICIE